MPINRAEIRAELPDGGPGVPDARIDQAIAAWEQRIELKAGASQLETPMGKEIVRLGATAEALGRMDRISAQSVAESMELRRTATGMLDDFDLISSAPGESGGVNANLVSNISTTPLWSMDDLLDSSGLGWP